MGRVLTLIFVGCISFAGFAVRAQPSGDVTATESIFQSLTSGSSSIDDFVSDVMGTDTTEQQISAIEGPLVVSVAPPEVNLGTVEALDSRTGRYPPRLKINFSEFPLRSWVSNDRSGNGRNADPNAQVDIIVRRIQNRLRVPQMNLAVQDRTAIVSGTVATARQRSLAESMLRFEPGIDTVQNNLTVISPEAQ